MKHLSLILAVLMLASCTGLRASSNSSGDSGTSGSSSGNTGAQPGLYKGGGK